MLMVSLKKFIPCKCGANNSFDFNSDMSIEDLTLSARCNACGSSVSITVSSLLSAPAQTQAQSAPVVQIVEPAAAAPVDENSAESVEQVVRAAVDAVIVGLRARATREEVTADRWLAVDVATSSCHRLAANVLREECDRLEKGV